ncbi:DUF4190 domain-containing protein [Nocardioides daphniae]|uniref:DUF4190 domain-containing protein n=1 Tax=Nocardioides daphniae TaxID=402297 RepID=A0ABQ1QCD8_9ACTN|nr:DUF4190 domain-containing protein [Nocardioides daphniae]GGD20993.1 hypothetical protein GCM10007231_20180 [Nocardioides daphniae]
MSDPSTPPNPYGDPGHGQQPGYDPYAVGGLGGGPVAHPRGTTVLVLGILGLVCCGFLAPVAWVMGASADNDVKAYPGRYSNAGSIKAGKILGIIGTAIIVLTFLAVMLLFAFGASMGLDSSSTPSSPEDWSGVQ